MSTRSSRSSRKSAPADCTALYTPSFFTISPALPSFGADGTLDQYNSLSSLVSILLYKVCFTITPSHELSPLNSFDSQTHKFCFISSQHLPLSWCCLEATTNAPALTIPTTCHQEPKHLVPVTLISLFYSLYNSQAELFLQSYIQPQQPSVQNVCLGYNTDVVSVRMHYQEPRAEANLLLQQGGGPRHSSVGRILQQVRMPQAETFLLLALPHFPPR